MKGLLGKKRQKEFKKKKREQGYFQKSKLFWSEVRCEAVSHRPHSLRITELVHEGSRTVAMFKQWIFNVFK